MDCALGQPDARETAPAGRGRRILLGLAALAVAAAIWLPLLHCFYRQPASAFYQAEGVSPAARELLNRHLEMWRDPAVRARELARMRRSNAEWDFMGRSFLVWALANVSLRDPAARSESLAVMDLIIEETLRLEAEKGIYTFLMPYARARAYEAQPARSLFIDGEIALMLAARRLVEEKPAYRALLAERARFIVERIEASPSLMAESYPDECWTFDHAVALVALRAMDRLDGTDHRAFCDRWLAAARQRLLHPESGLLASSCTRQGVPMDGPEGSTLWMVAHCLQPLDPGFARDQYDRSRRELGRTLLGFGYAREWPASWHGPTDIDSGPIIPVLEISAGSSGMAFIGAAAFGDTEYVSELHATLNLAAFPQRKGGALRYCASNQVGDAALLYAAVLGPLWQRIAGDGKP